MPFRRQGAFGLRDQTSVSLKLNTNTHLLAPKIRVKEIHSSAYYSKVITKPSWDRHPVLSTNYFTPHSHNAACTEALQKCPTPAHSHSCCWAVQDLVIASRQSFLSSSYQISRQTEALYLLALKLHKACPQAYIFYIVVRARNYFILDTSTPILLSSRGYQMKVQVKAQQMLS